LFDINALRNDVISVYLLLSHQTTVTILSLHTTVLLSLLDNHAPVWPTATSHYQSVTSFR